MTHNTVLIEACDLFNNMLFDNYYIPVQFSNSDTVDILRFEDDQDLIHDQTDADRFFKAFHFAFSVCLSHGFAAMEDHIKRNFGPITFVGLLPLAEAKTAVDPEIASQIDCLKN